MSSHSPAPWEIHRNVLENGDIHIAANYAKEEHGYPVFVAMVDSGMEGAFGRDVAVANAHVMMASPDLLSAAEDAELWFDEYCPENVRRAAAASGVRAKLQAAIAKAKGELDDK